MKRKLCGILALMMILSACENTDDTEIVTTTAATEETDFLTENVPVEMITEEVTAETVPAVPDRFSDLADPDPESDIDAVKKGYFVLDLNSFADENSRFTGNIGHIGKDNICAVYERTGSDEGRYFLMIDLVHSEVIGRGPDENASDCGIREEKDLAYVRLNNVYKVNGDGTFEQTDYETLWEIPDTCGDHNIVYTDSGLTDTRKGELLVENHIADRNDDGSANYDSMGNIYYSFAGAVNDDRFIYKGTGYEWTTGFGVYDYITGTAADIPGTNGKYFVGVLGSRLYLAESEYDGDGRSLYVSDINTRETKLLTDLSDLGENLWVSYTYPDDGAVIGAYANDPYTDGKGVYLLIDPLSGEITKKLPEVFANNGTFFTDSYICTIDEEDNATLCYTERKRAYSTLDMNIFADEGFRMEAAEFCGNDNLFVKYSPEDGQGIPYIAVIDIARGEEIDRIVPDKGEDHIRLSPANPCAGIGTSRYETDIYGNVLRFDETFRLCVFAPDGTYKFIDDPDVDMWDQPAIFGDRIISMREGSLVDLTNDEILIPAYREEGDEYGLRSVNYMFALPLDDSRFIYERIGYETMYGLGIYDMDTKTAVELPDSRILPEAVSGDRLYSVEYEYAGYGTNIYVTDLQTGVSEILCPVPYNAGGEERNAYSYIFAPSDGGFIGALKCGDTDEKRLALIDPDSGSVFYETILPADIGNNSIIATDKFICASSETDTGILYLIDRGSVDK